MKTIRIPETYREDSESTQEEMQARGITYVEFTRTDEFEKVKAKLEEANRLLMQATSDIERRMNSDDACGHPFDEDLGSLDLSIKEYFNRK